MPKRESFMLVISLFLFTVLIVLRDIYLIPIPGHVVSLFFVASLLFLSYNDTIKATFYLMPFTNGVPGYTVLFTLIILLLKTRRLNIGQILPAALIAFLELANVSFFNIEARYTSVISYICFITLFFLILFNQDRRIDKKACVKYFCYGVTVALPIVYIPIILNYSFDTVISGEVRGSMIMGYEQIVNDDGSVTLEFNRTPYLINGNNGFEVSDGSKYSYECNVVCENNVVTVSASYAIQSIRYGYTCKMNSAIMNDVSKMVTIFDSDNNPLDLFVINK